MKFDHEPVCDDYHTRFTGFAQWLDSTLIYAEELGKERGYFDEHSPYMATYNRKLTLQQQRMREAYGPLAEEDHLEEIEGDNGWEEEDDFNL